MMIKKILIFSILSLLLILPVVNLYAEGTITSGLSKTIDNPLSGTAGNLTQLITAILKLVAQLGAVVCVFYIIYSGFLFVTAQGNDKKITDAKHIFFWSVVGTAVLLGASVVAEVIRGTVNSVTGSNL
jgi:hypothetical protein